VKEESRRTRASKEGVGDMKDRKKLLWSLVLAILLSATLFPPCAWAFPKKYLFLGTGNLGGTYYSLGAGVANVFNKRVPRVRVITESTASPEEYFKLMLREKMDMARVSTHSIE
jgi:uncharacterized protein